jgi:hypothetical protein
LCSDDNRSSASLQFALRLGCMRQRAAPGSHTGCAADDCTEITDGLPAERGVYALGYRKFSVLWELVSPVATRSTARR